MFAAPICGCAQHLNHPVHPLAVNDCLRETWLDAALPVIFLLFSAIINTCRRYREWRNGFFRLPENDTDGLRLPLARPYVLLRRSLLLLVFCLLEISCWAFLFAWRLESAILERDNAELHSSNDACSTPLYQVIDPSVALIARIYVLVLVIKSFTTPADPVILSKLTVYNPHFLVFYSLALLSAVARIFSYFVIGSQTEWLTSSTIEKSFAIIDLVICIILWFVSATTPTELDPRELMDFEDDDSGVLVLHDGRTVRNGRILSMEATASPLSTVTFSWMNDLLEKAKKSPLMADQLWALPLRLRAQDNYRYFKRFTSKHLLHRLIRANLKTIIYQFFTAVAAVAFHYANAFYLLRLLNYIQDPQDQPKEVGYVYCGAIFACNVIGTLVASQTLLWGRRWHVTLSNMLNSEIYAHALQSSNASNVWKTETKHNAETDPTTLENQQATLMTQDTERLAELASYLHVFYTCPLEIAVGAIFLYKLLGNAFLAGLSVMVFALPAIHYISRKLTHVQKRLAEAKSWRVRLLTELCNGIKITKLMAWEQKWEQVITSARDDELVKLIKMYTQNTMLSLIWFAAPVFVTTVSFAWYTLVERNTLDASTAFVSIVVFGMLRDPLNVMPQALMAYSDAKVSLGHITTFLNSGEKHADTDSSPLNDPSILSYKSRSRTGFDSGVFGWPNPNTSNPKMSCTPHPSGSHSLSRTDLPPSNYGSTSNHGAPFASAGFALMVPTFDFPDASLSVIVGPSNSGKTSLLFALLGELVSNHGRSYLPLRFLSPRTSTIRDEHQPHLYAYRVAYVAQIPWIQSATVRENILFSEPWDDSRYRAVLYQCDLMKDLAAFENGDLTSVDDGGTFITETQRQKISLARAVYSKAKTVIIDDIFSTFSQATTRSLYTKCLNGELMQGRTIILACQRRDAEWFQDAKLIVHMEAGRADICETPESILEWIQTNTVPSDRDTVLRNDDHVDALFECGPALVEDDVFDERSIMRESTRYTEDDRGGHLPHQSRDMAYATYFSACGGWRFWMAAIVLTILARFASILESYWLKVWSMAYAHLRILFDNVGSSTATTASIDPSKSSMNHYIIVYLGICLTTVAFNFIRTVIQYRGSLRASNRLFLRLLQVTCRLPFQFFDSASQSYIMSRFSKDIEVIDGSIGWHVNFLLQTLFGVVGIMITIGFILPEFFIASVVVAFIYLSIGITYIRASRELKKMNSETRIPIFSLYTDALAGVSTIRAYGLEYTLLKKMFYHLDQNMRPFYTLWTTNRWLFVRVELLGSFLSLFISVMLVRKMDTIDAGLAGIALTFAIHLLEYIYWLMRQSTTVDMHFEAVERINEFVNLPQEPPGIVEGCRPPAAWPVTAGIQVRDLTVNFGPDEQPMLEHVSFNVLPGEKVAILSRANGEKEALIACFFRFVDPLRGSIKIDGVNIAWIGVQDLRSRMTFIPKTGGMMNGTIRSNLDPFGEYDDYELWQALYRVELASLPSSETTDNNNGNIIEDLDMEIQEDDERLSIGTRQLLCMARGILRDCTRLVIMEEVDLTDEMNHKIKHIIHREFEGSTMLVITNRLQSTRHYDRVLVFDHRIVAEDDTPGELLSSQSMLRSLFERAGILTEEEEMEEDLEE